MARRARKVFLLIPEAKLLLPDRILVQVALATRLDAAPVRNQLTTAVLALAKLETARVPADAQFEVARAAPPSVRHLRATRRRDHAHLLLWRRLQDTRQVLA